MAKEPTTSRKSEKSGKRPDDARGAPPGAGVYEPPHGGRIGNPPFVPTEEQRAKVRTYAKTFPAHGEHFIARLMGFSRDTLRRHFADDIELGRAEMLAAVGSQMINRAMNADSETAKGDIDAQKFILARLGGWTTKVEMTGRGGRPIEHVDLSRLSAEQLEEYGRLAAIAEGLDPEEVMSKDD